MNAGLTPQPAQGTVLITPTQRLSRYLQYKYAASQLAAGRKAWETPDIQTWNGCVRRLWDEHAAVHNIDLVVLSTQQQHAVWQQIVADSAWSGQLLQSSTAATQALSAWNLCQQWQMPVFPASVHLNEDARAFKNWTDDYTQLCNSRGWIDEAGIAGRLAKEAVAESIKATGELVLVGFDVFTPQQRCLLKTLSDLGCVIREEPLDNRNHQVISSGFSDAAEEIGAAAIWSRKKLETEPAGSIGIVVPDLRALHNQIEYSFEDKLLPGALLSPQEALLRPYSISLGLPLIRYPVIDAAFSILNLGSPLISVEDVGGLLRSPFIGGTDAETAGRAKLDACLRENGQWQLTVRTLLDIAGHYMNALDQPAVFLSFCRQWQETWQTLPGSQSAHNWARDFSALLKLFEWPGKRPLNSAEYQALEAWQGLISQFASLDLVSPPLSYGPALTHLRQLATSFSFQPETPEVPVQILGFAGAAGMQFDHLWVMGLQEETWPGKAEPHPFIPVALQRKAGLPDSSPETRLMYASTMTERLIASSPDVVLSYPQNDKERPLRVSPLIKPYLKSLNNVEKIPAMPYASQIFASRKFEHINDWQAPPVMTGQAVKGGAALFKNQAACPFRAFARHRLFAEGLKSADIGPDAMARGLMLHKLMELLWQRLQDYNTLASKNGNELEALIDAVVTKVINTYRRKFRQTYTRRFMQLEKQRLGSLLKEWLAIEHERKPFTVVSREEIQKILIQDIEIKTRVDRIDRLADGRYVILDYKTGDIRTNSWFSDRPEEPQLPLYAVTNSGVAGIAFARIKRGHLAFLGLAVEGDLIPGVCRYSEAPQAAEFARWEDLLSAWKGVLAQLAEAFRKGDARVDPRDENACRVCDLHALCRIYEQKATSDW